MQGGGHGKKQVGGRAVGELQEQEHNRHIIMYVYSSQRISVVLTPFMVLVGVRAKHHELKGVLASCGR